MVFNDDEDDDKDSIANDDGGEGGVIRYWNACRATRQILPSGHVCIIQAPPGKTYVRRTYDQVEKRTIHPPLGARKAMSSNSTDAEVFIYTGPGGNDVPRDVVRIQIDPSVTSISANAFYERKKLAEVELCEGVVEIGDCSFGWCNHSITKINIPNSIRRIKDYAFGGSLRTPICLHDDIESIGNGAFMACRFTNFRVPPLITVIPDQMLRCNSIFSLELSEDVVEIGESAFAYCYCLRNVAIPPNAVFDAIFIDEDDREYQETLCQHLFIDDNMDTISDLLELFGSEAAIISELQHRFDGLPIHKLVYYQSYYQGVLQNLIAAINTRSGQRRKLRNKLDPTGNQQDCLGMTPLHILTCSSVHNLEMYSLIIENYPTNLITEDRWGALPLLYAFWGAAPAEIRQFLLESYQSLYPGYLFNWTMMVETMGRTDTPKENIEYLLRVKQMHFPDQSVDWDYLLHKFAFPTKHSFGGLQFEERMKYLVTCGLSTRVEALPFKVWRGCISNMIQNSNFSSHGDYQNSNFENYGDNLDILREIQSKLACFKNELPQLKEATTILELALWKIKMNEKSHQDVAAQSQKRVKTDESSSRQQCRVTCGADVVIGHVLPFLITA